MLGTCFLFMGGIFGACLLTEIWAAAHDTFAS